MLEALLISQLSKDMLLLQKCAKHHMNSPHHLCKDTKGMAHVLMISTVPFKRKGRKGIENKK